MEKQIKEIEFEKLRIAYITVKKFLENKVGLEGISLDSKIAEDMSFYGDDNYYLLEEFVRKLELDYKDFEYDKHFLSEGEILFNPLEILIRLLLISVELPVKLIEKKISRKIDLTPEFIKDRDVKDLTFKDLITWYVEGSFNLSEAIKYEIKTPHNK